MNDTVTNNLKNFFDDLGAVGLKSTGAMLVNYHGVLYNVDGSSDDPEINGKNWAQLLKSYNINSNCYVTNPTPEGNSHPNFNVGGHMTENSDGKVNYGADTYLMPLCSWHNHKSRDGVPFTHVKTLMLKLSGFMQSEIAATFIARLPSEEVHSIIYKDIDGWKSSNLTPDDVQRMESGVAPEEAVGFNPEQFVTLERAFTEGEERYFVRKLQLNQ